MKKIRLIFALSGLLALAGNAYADPTIDSIVQINVIPEQIQFTSFITTTSTTTEYSVYVRVTGTLPLITIESWAFMPLGSSFDMVFAPVDTATTYDVIIALRDLPNGDSVGVSFTRTTPRYVPATAYNDLQAFFPTQVTQLLTVHYDMGWSTGEVAHQYTPDAGANWYLIPTGLHLNMVGYGLDSMWINQPLGTTVGYRSIAKNSHFPNDYDTSNVIWFTTIAPFFTVVIDHAYFNAPVGNQALLDYLEHSDSGGTTVAIYRNDVPTFSGNIDTIFFFANTGSHQANIWIEGDGPMTTTYIWVITTNAFTSDTSAMLQFTTTSGMPTILQPAITGYNDALVTVDLESVVGINDAMATVFFFVTNANDTNLVVLNSTTVLNSGTTTYSTTISLGSPGCYRAQGVIQNTVGAVVSNFSVPFCVGSFVGIEDPYVKVTAPHEAKIFDSIGRLVRETIVEDEALYMKTVTDLPAGVYILHNGKEAGKKFTVIN